MTKSKLDAVPTKLLPCPFCQSPVTAVPVKGLGGVTELVGCDNQKCPASDISCRPERWNVRVVNVVPTKLSEKQEAPEPIPERIWIQVYNYGEGLSASVISPKEVHDNGKPVYEYVPKADLDKAVAERDEVVNAVLKRVGKRWRSMPIEETNSFEFNGPDAAIVADSPGAALVVVNMALDKAVAGARRDVWEKAVKKVGCTTGTAVARPPSKRSSNA